MPYTKRALFKKMKTNREQEFGYDIFISVLIIIISLYPCMFKTLSGS